MLQHHQKADDHISHHVTANVGLTGLGEASGPGVVLAADTGAAKGWNGRVVGGGGNSEGLSREVGKDLAGGLASGAPFFDG
jgi:hypothetical protein